MVLQNSNRKVQKCNANVGKVAWLLTCRTDILDGFSTLIVDDLLLDYVVTSLYLPAVVVNFQPGLAPIIGHRSTSIVTNFAVADTIFLLIRTTDVYCLNDRRFHSSNSGTISS